MTGRCKTTLVMKIPAVSAAATRTSSRENFRSPAWNSVSGAVPGRTTPPRLPVAATAAAGTGAGAPAPAGPAPVAAYRVRAHHPQPPGGLVLSQARGGAFQPGKNLTGRQSRSRGSPQRGRAGRVFPAAGNGNCHLATPVLRAGSARRDAAGQPGTPRTRPRRLLSLELVVPRHQETRWLRHHHAAVRAELAGHPPGGPAGERGRPGHPGVKGRGLDLALAERAEPLAQSRAERPRLSPQAVSGLAASSAALRVDARLMP